MVTTLTKAGWFGPETNGVWSNVADVVNDPKLIEVRSGTVANTLGGDDSIKGGSTFPSDLPEGIYIAQNGTLNTGGGNDSIVGIGNTHGIVNYGTLDTGAGNDSITGAGLNSDSILNYGLIDTGGGDDSITAALGAYSTGVSILNYGTIKTGDGNDSITGGSILNYGTIKTGDGSDTFGASEAFLDSSFGENANGSVFLGRGKDTLRGFGAGYFNGGGGVDTLALSGGTSYTIGISGTTVTVKSNGTTMYTSEFEKLMVGPTTVFDFSSLTNGQNIVG